MKKLKNNKRAQIFSILAILVISLLFLSFELYSYIYERDAVTTRVSTMDNYLYSIEKNLERQMFVSGYRILFLAENYITDTGTYIDVDEFFNEAFFNGTVNGVPRDVNGDILDGATYSDINASLIQKASNINVDIILYDSIINVSQDDPWNVKFSLISEFVMRDKENLAYWNKNQTINAYVPITNFEDPLFTVNSYARVFRGINQTPYEGNYVTGSDVSNLYNHVENGYYATNPNAPSFLKRMEGDLSADEEGIESFVNILDLSNQGISVSDKSCVDYIYFSGENPSYYSVSGMQSWFRIDYIDNHQTKYQIP